MMAWLSGLFGSATVAVEAAQLRDAPRLAALHSASFHRGWGEGEFEDMLRQPNTLMHRLRQGSKFVGFAVSGVVYYLSMSGGFANRSDVLQQGGAS